MAKKDKKQKNKINWRRTWRNNLYMLKFIAKAAPDIIIVAFLSGILSAVNNFLVNTYLYKYALNALQEGKPISQILVTLGTMLAFSLFCIVFYQVEEYYFSVRSPKVNLYIQKTLYKKASQLELSCFENAEFYDKYVKATNNASGRAFQVMWSLSDFIYVAINVGAAATMIITISPLFMIFAFLPLICTSIIGKRRNRTRYDYNMKNNELNRQKNYVNRTFYFKDYSKEMRLTDMWNVMYKRMHDSVAELKATAKKYGPKIMLFRYTYTVIFDFVVYMGSIIVAAFKTLVRKNMLLGDCFVVINSITGIAGNINYVGNAILRLDENSLYIDNIREFLEYEPKMPEDETAPTVSKVETIEIKGLSFNYEGKEDKVLEDINITLKAGEKIAIVGHNGAGKSTFVKLLQRFYDPVQGEILLNGRNIKEYRLSSYRSLFGTVFQDYTLFATTVAENVMLKGDLSDEERARAEAALKRSGVWEKVQSLPKGMDTVVTKEFDDEGAVFSGGEAQKISIAKIFAGDQEIVILDEPTSALDPIAEQKMYNNMFEACEGKTVIFISHRLSSATMADRVYLFDKGRIAEQGTHKELLAIGGKYADMWEKQATAYLDGNEI